MKQKEENNIIDSAKTGAKYGSTLGAGLGVGLGVCNYAIGNSFKQVSVPVASTFFSKWNITQPTTLPYVSLRRSVGKFGLATSLVCALAGGAGGSIHGFFKALTNKEVKQDNELADHQKPEL